MPQDTSKIRNDMKTACSCSSVSIVMTEVANAMVKMTNGICSTRCDMRLKIPLPIEIITINVAKTRPYGIVVLDMSSAGVHRKTKVYIAPPKNDCVRPIIHIFVSITAIPS